MGRSRLSGALRQTMGVGEIEAAARRIEGLVRVTPLLPAGELSRRVGAKVLLKAENLQLTDSFKPRGALNRVLQLAPDQLGGGVAAGSAGNHAQALAYAARRSGTHAVVFMPAHVPVAARSAPS